MKKTTIIIDQGSYKLPELEGDFVYLINFSDDLDLVKSVKDALVSRGIQYEDIDFYKIYQDGFDDIRDEYLKWGFDFSFQKIHHKTIREHLEYDGYSLWWGTKLSEKNAMTNPYIFTVFKLMVLENLIKERHINTCMVLSDDEKLKRTLQDLFIHYDISSNLNEIIFKKRKINSVYLLMKVSRSFLISMYRVFLIRLFCHKKKHIKHNISNYFLYYPSINLKKNALGVFQSNYLGPLHNLVDKKDLNIILFYNKAQNISFFDAIKNCNNYNKNSKKHDFFLLEEGLLFKDLFLNYLKCICRVIKNRVLIKSSLFIFQNRKLNVYAYYQQDWINSVVGSGLATTIINMKKFETTYQLLGTQKSLIYLFENLSWEKYLLFYWKRINSDKDSIGVIHAVFREGLLNMYDHKESYHDTTDFKCQYPSKIGANSINAEAFYIDRFKDTDISVVKVEAQRFAYLENQKPNIKGKNLLIVTSISSKDTYKLLRIFKNAYADSDLFENIFIKPHPYLDFQDVMQAIGEFPPYALLNTPLNEALEGVGVVYSDISTSVIIETLFLGIPTISYADINSFFMTPVKQSSLKVARSERQLRELLMTAFESTTERLENYFFLDQYFSRWRKVLEG